MNIIFSPTSDNEQAEALDFSLPDNEKSQSPTEDEITIKSLLKYPVKRVPEKFASFVDMLIEILNT